MYRRLRKVIYSIVWQHWQSNITYKNGGRWRFLSFFLKHLTDNTRLPADVLSDQTGDFIDTRILPKLSPIRFHSRLFFLKELRGWMGLKDPLSSIPFIIWQSPQDHQILLFLVHTRKKHFRAYKGASSSCSSLWWERENTTLLSCRAYLNLTSDQITGG